MCQWDHMDLFQSVVVFYIRDMRGYFRHFRYEWDRMFLFSIIVVKVKSNEMKLKTIKKIIKKKKEERFKVVSSITKPIAFSE